MGCAGGGGCRLGGIVLEAGAESRVAYHFEGGLREAIAEGVVNMGVRESTLDGRKHAPSAVGGVRVGMRPARPKYSPNNLASERLGLLNEVGSNVLGSIAVTRFVVHDKG